MLEGESFLKQKFDLHKAPEVARPVDAIRKMGKKISHDPEAEIGRYLKSYQDILERKDSSKRDRGIRAIKRMLHTYYVIKPDEVPDSYFDFQKRIAREQGHGDIEITPDIRDEMIKNVITNQTRSLDNWVDYLSSEDAMYPMWAKYWAIRSVINMGGLRKYQEEDGEEKAKFTKRTKSTTASFPVLNPRALAMTIGVMKDKIEKDNKAPIENISKKLSQEEFQKLLSSENFAKIYAQLLIEMPEYSTEGLKETRGQWVKYLKDSDPDQLVKSLEGHPLEWCTADPDIARKQLQVGDFYVYYSINDEGKAVVPRLAIRMEGNKIAEPPRGIAPDQNLDPYIAPILEEKLDEFPDKQNFLKRSSDMKRLTAIEEKIKQGTNLDKQELTFLYEIDSKIEGFGYKRDPRIAEIISQRNPEQDMPIVFECTPDQIARNSSEINQNTKAYVGSFESHIFAKIREYNIKHVYSKFPEGKIEIIRDFEVAPMTLDEFEKMAAEYNKSITDESLKIEISDYAKYMFGQIGTEKHPALKGKENLDLFRLKVRDLFNDENTHTIDQIYARAEELGLNLCPPEVGPTYRLEYTDQPMNEWFRVAMEQISVPAGRPLVFTLKRDESGSWLSNGWAGPGFEWGPDNEFVFCLRKLAA
uniref:Uncharacterized protein n=1 Tax=candidate division CPR3 bacterium TaxID=2268181 RepID=A0A7C4M2G8_UNCC3